MPSHEERIQRSLPPPTISKMDDEITIDQFVNQLVRQRGMAGISNDEIAKAAAWASGVIANYSVLQMVVDGRARLGFVKGKPMVTYIEGVHETSS